MLISCLRFLWQEPGGSGHGTSVSARSPSRCAWLSRLRTNNVIRDSWHVARRTNREPRATIQEPRSTHHVPRATNNVPRTTPLKTHKDLDVWRAAIDTAMVKF